VVEVYLKHQTRIYESFAPSKKQPFPQGVTLKNVQLSWSTLKDVAGLVAFYVTRLAQASTSKEFDGNNLTHYDNIYPQRIFKNDPTAGLNRNTVVVPTELKPKTTYGYFVEITDANVGGQANICIFQPHQFFKTP
jgi:chitodextrinase